MEFAGVNYLAIILAAIAGQITGALWYGLLANRWMKASGVSKEQTQEMTIATYGVALVAQFIIAILMAGLIGHLGYFSPTSGAITAFFVWLGFCAAPMAVNHRFQMAGWDLTIIDAGYWLVVFCLQGAIIGWMGV